MITNVQNQSNAGSGTSLNCTITSAGGNTLVTPVRKGRGRLALVTQLLGLTRRGVVVKRSASREQQGGDGGKREAEGS